MRLRPAILLLALLTAVAGAAVPLARHAGAAAGLAPLPPKQVEKLDRGAISVRSGNANLVSWRLLGTDPAGVTFNVYRGRTRVNRTPVATSTNFLDANGPAGAAYTVR